MKLIDLTGQKFGQLTVLKRDIKQQSKQVYWICQCDCGNIKSVAGNNLKNGNVQSCGCLRKQKAKQMGLSQKQNLIGQKFEYLTVIEETNLRQGSNVIWKCKCQCGNITYVAASDLKRGSTKSCGCMKSSLNSKAHQIDMINKKFGNLVVLKEAGLDPDGSYNYLCKCNCGNKKIINGVSLRKGITTSCGCINYSIGEKRIEEILKNNNIRYKREYQIKELNNKRFDFIILSDNESIKRIIEFDGRQHYEKYNNLDWENNCPLEVRKQRDQEKNQWAKDNNIPLVRIPYWERDNITLDMILGDKYLVC